MTPHLIQDDSDGPTIDLAWVTPAKPEHAATVMSHPADHGHDGRSGWHWIRLRDGTLILGVFPQGDTYIEVSDAGVCDWGDPQS